MDALILGGGLAGLACGVDLAESGARVGVLEAGPRAGGKASSWRDADGDIVDFGQHVVTPLYEHLLALLERVGAADGLIWKDGHYWLAERGGRVGSIRVADLPAPLHFLAGLLGYRGLPLLDRLSAIPAFTEILLSSDRHRRRFDRRTFRDWARGRGVSERLITHMLDPMIEGLMFLDCHHVSTTNVLFDLHYMLRDRHAARFGFFDGGLQERLIDPIVAHLERCGGTLRTGEAVRAIHLRNGLVQCVELASGERRTADVYVSALPLHVLREALPDAARDDAELEGLWHLEPTPIVSAQLWFDRKVMDISDLVLTPGCVFNAYADLSNILTEYARREGSIVHFVLAPAGHLVDMDRHRIVRQVAADFRDVFPAARGARVVKSTVVKSPRGFYRQLPGAERHRPPQRTSIANLFLAGDFTRNPYPPCMEGAVTSGQLAAQAVLAHGARDRSGPRATIVRTSQPGAPAPWRPSDSSAPA